MKKLFALALVVLGLAACQTDPSDLDVNFDGTTTVCLTLPEDAITRAGGSDSAATGLTNTTGEIVRFIMEIYDENGVKSAQRYVDYADEGTLSVTFPVQLVPGRAYTFVAWADMVDAKADVDKYYDTSDLKNITLLGEWNAMEETRDAFTDNCFIDNYSGASTIELNLVRPFAKVRVVATDLPQVKNLHLDPTTATVTYTKPIPVSYNAFEQKVGTATESKVHTKFALVGANDEKLYGDNSDTQMVLYADYIFANNEQGAVSFTIETFDQNDQTIKLTTFNTDIAVKRNMLTTIKGDIMTTSKNITVEIENAGEFGSTHDISAISSAAALLKAIKIGGNIMLTQDITITAADLLSAGILSTRASAIETILNLNGYGITFEDNVAVTIPENTTLTIQDNSENGEGSIVVENTTTTDGIYGGFVNEGAIVIEGGNLDEGTINNTDKGEVTITNGNVNENVVTGVTEGKVTNYANDIKKAFDEGTDYTLTTDIVLAEGLVLEAGKTVNLNLGGYTLSGKSATQNTWLIDNYGTLNISNGTITFNYVGEPDTNYGKGNYTIYNNGQLTVDANINIVAGTEGDKFRHALYAVNSAGEFTLNGGKIYNATNIAVRQWIGSETKPSNITVNGGEIEGLRAIWMQLPNSDTSKAPKGKLTVNGGKLIGTAIDGTMDSDNILAVYSYSYGNQMKNVEIEVNGGEIVGDIALTGGRGDAKVDVEKVTINGGKFTGLWGDVYSYADDKLAAEAITIKGGEFSSIVPATYLNGAQEIVKLHSDVTLDEAFTFAYGNEGTIDLNGKTISHAMEQTGNHQMILNDGNLTIIDSVGGGKISYTDLGNGGNYVSNTITNRGTLTVKGGTIENLSSLTVAKNGYPYAIDTSIWGEATEVVVNIEGGVISSEYSPLRLRADSTDENVIGNISGGELIGRIDHQMSSSKAGVKAELNITGGTFTPNNKTDVIMIFGAGANTDASGIVANISGGTFKGGIRVNETSLPIGQNFNKKFITGGIFYTDVTALLAEGYSLIENDGETFKVVRKAVAKVGENTYETLLAAINAVEDGGTITIIEDIIFNEHNRVNNGGSWYEGLLYDGDKSFTIDLNDKTITNDASVNDYLLYFKNNGEKANTITIKNGTVDAAPSVYAAIATASSNAQKITMNLENIAINGNNSNGAVVKFRGGGVLNVKAGTVITGENNYCGIEVVGTETIANIYDGVEIYQNGTSSYVGAVAGVNYNATMNVYGGEGVSAKCGLIVMSSGGTINVEGGEWTANGNGTPQNDNFGVLVSQFDNATYPDAVSSVLNVKGGTFRGGYNCYGNVADKAFINIYGGNFNADPAGYVVAGYEVTEENGIYNVGK